MLEGVYSVQVEDFARVVEVWEASVRATHHFLSEDDIQHFKPMVQNGLVSVPELACVRDSGHGVVGFVAVADRKVEMLFVDPLWRGEGVGKRLLRYAVETSGATALDVNEQNDQAVGFYLKMGFRVRGRSELDGTGRPFPLLHMQLP